MMNLSDVENKIREREMADCPDLLQLQKYLAGDMDASVQKHVEAHIVNCALCDQRLAELDQDLDSFAQAIKDTTIEDTSSTNYDAAEVIALQAATALRFDSTSTDLESIGSYELIRSIGSGGMGSVYLARHKTLNKQVALKLLPLRWTPDRADLIKRFEREIRAAGQLEHASIVAARDAGTDKDVHYLVMDYIDGYDLSKIAKTTTELSIADVAEIGYQVAQGLAHAHSQGMVHRDVKPSNIIVNRQGQVKILDFGLVLMNPWEESASELTTVGHFLGTLDYMAPEQAERSGGVDYRADLYALGATLFRLLAGRPPLAAAPNLSPLEKLRLISNHNPPSIRALRSDIPLPFSNLIDQLLKTAPAHRPTSASHVVETLDAHRAGADLASLVKSTPNHDETLPDSHAVIKLPKVDSRGRKTKSWAKWITTALIPLSLLSGFVIHLSTDNGTLIIESEDPQLVLEVTRVDAASKPLDFNIQTDGPELRLSSGEYEVLLKNTADSQLRLERDRVLITRGDREVLKVSRMLSDSKVTNQSKLYKGQSYEQWVTVLHREQSVAAIGEAMRAVITLAEPHQQYEAATACLYPSRFYGSESSTGGGFSPTAGGLGDPDAPTAFMGYLWEAFWQLDTAPAMQALLDEIDQHQPKSTIACLSVIGFLDDQSLAQLVTTNRELVVRARNQLLQRNEYNHNYSAMKLTMFLHESISNFTSLAAWVRDSVKAHPRILLAYEGPANLLWLRRDGLQVALELDLLENIDVGIVAATLMQMESLGLSEQEVARVIQRISELGQANDLAKSVFDMFLNSQMLGLQLPPVDSTLADFFLDAATLEEQQILANSLETHIKDMKLHPQLANSLIERQAVHEAWIALLRSASQKSDEDTEPAVAP